MNLPPSHQNQRPRRSPVKRHAMSIPQEHSTTPSSDASSQLPAHHSGAIPPDARLPKMTLTKYKIMQRSLRNAKILQSKRKEIIKEQRLLIADLRKQQQKLAESSVSIDSVHGKQFILGQMRKCNVNKRARRYSGYDKNFALALHYCSPKCYRFLRKMFVLPTVRSLQRWLQNINVEPGFINPVLEMLKVKSANLPQAQKLCSLAFDEMSLKQLLTYNSQSDLFEGFVTAVLDDPNSAENSAASGTRCTQDFTNECAEDTFFHMENETYKSPALANQAMVVLMRGIHSNFKQVIGYFLSANAMNGELLKDTVLQSIRNVQDAGFVPKVICYRSRL